MKTKCKYAGIVSLLSGLVAGLLWLAAAQQRDVAQDDLDRLWRAYRDL